MYAIANVVLGTILPWSVPDDAPEGAEVIIPVLDVEYAKLWPNNVDWTEDDDAAYAADPADAELTARWAGFFEETTLNGDDETLGWVSKYHGASPIPSAFVGVKLDEFDEGNHLPLTRLTAIAPTDEQTAAALAKYRALPARVRAVLPPFGLYILWSTS